MSLSGLTVERYEQAERAIAHDEARIGLTVHGIVAVVVSIALVMVNFVVADEFPWSAFAVGGMVLGLAAHWWFGSHELDEQLTAQQYKVEARAARLP